MLSFGNLSPLEAFRAYNNNLVGTIPSSFGQFTKLSSFTSSSNRLSGTIPPSIFYLSSLKIFGIGDNQMHGSLPSNIGFTLPNIARFSIANNQFIGSIPNSISNASNLYDPVLNNNKLSGKVHSLEKLYKITFFLALPLTILEMEGQMT